MTLELFELGPGVYIPYLILSFLITAGSYAIFPLLFARIRKKNITARKFRFFCFLFNFMIMAFFIALNGSSSGAPYLIWTSVFCHYGLKTLKKRNIIVISNTMVQNNDSDMSMQCTNKKNNSFDSEFSPTKQIKSKKRFCVICGNPIDQETKRCSSCGKRYSCMSWSFLQSALFVTAVISIIICFLCMYRIGLYYTEIEQLKVKISDLNVELEKSELRATKAEEELEKQSGNSYDLLLKIAGLNSKIHKIEKSYNFLYNNVVFVSGGGNGEYHKCDCPYFDDSYYWAYNIELAKLKGYYPCSVCSSPSFSSLIG